MESNQQKYIEYVKQFAEKSKSHIWLGGSFLHGDTTPFSDVDISAYCDAEHVHELIYGYGKPVYISYTSNPVGILIIIYEDGVAVDLEIIEEIDVAEKEFFHVEDIKVYNYSRNEKICKEFALRDDMQYQMSRLLHRSLIKFLSGKRAVGVSVANEIMAFINSDSFIDEADYQTGMVNLLKSYNEQFEMPSEYYDLLCKLIEML